MRRHSVRTDSQPKEKFIQPVPAEAGIKSESFSQAVFTSLPSHSDAMEGRAAAGADFPGCFRLAFAAHFVMNKCG